MILETFAVLAAELLCLHGLQQPSAFFPLFFDHRLLPSEASRSSPFRVSNLLLPTGNLEPLE